MSEVSGQAERTATQICQSQVGCYPPYDQISVEVVANAVAWLESLGYDLHTEHTRMTPHRISWYVMSVLRREREIHITTFANQDPKVEDMVVVPGISIWSACSHHLLPFFGRVDFGYIPGDRLVGFSKIPWLIREMARGPWMQEHLTHHIADRFNQELDAGGVIVRTVCMHTCAMLDLDSADVPSLTLCALRGDFIDRPDCVREFMSHVC